VETLGPTTFKFLVAEQGAYGSPSVAARRLRGIDNLDGPAQMRFSPGDKTWFIALVCPQVGQAWESALQPGQQLLTPFAFREIGWVNMRLEH